MITWAVVGLALCSMVRSQETPPPAIIPDEWDCENHRKHPTDPNQFQQSAIGFDNLTPEQEALFVFDMRCPIIHQIFDFDDTGKCFCLYSDELNAILASDCTLRAEPTKQPYDYSEINPNRNVTAISDMWEPRSCLEVLRQNQIQGYQTLGIVPMFFNQTGCRCQWTQAGIDNFIPAQGDTICEIIFDKAFNTQIVNGDSLGNWITMQPHYKQRNLTVQEGGNLFDGEVRAAVAKVMAANDFLDINMITRFRTFDNNNGVPQIIFSNICEKSGGEGGSVDLRYTSNTQTYTLQFFGLTASCQPAIPSGPNAIQVVMVRYRFGEVSMRVNGGDCDVSAINSAGFEPRLQFNVDCPFQIGGRVGTDPEIDGFGELIEPGAKFNGIMFSHTVLRNCETVPSEISARL